ncbi:TPA: hypothetical protein ACGUUT_004352 [Vibrio vulnificus]
MSNEVELIVNAIEGLHSNIAKDYILPIGSVLVSGMLGAGVAYYTVHRQEFTKIELEKVKTVNATFLAALEFRNNLIGIKKNYEGRIETDPYQRMLAIPPILLKENTSKFDIAALSFLVNGSSPSNPVDKWASIDYIANIGSNYDVLYGIWKKRNEVITGLMPELSPFFGVGFSNAALEKAIGKGNLATITDLTERCLHMTDDLIVELSCFMLGFSHSLKGKIDLRIQKSFGGVLHPTLPSYDEFPAAVDVLSKVPSVNLRKLARVQNVPREVVAERYRPLYK